MRPSTTLSLRIDGNLIEEHAQTDNLMLYERTGQNYKAKKLVIAKAYRLCGTHPTRSSSDALCETVITWTNNGKNLKQDLDSDQTVAIIATQKMLNVE
jgi:D-citramalate synthase